MCAHCVCICACMWACVHGKNVWLCNFFCRAKVSCSSNEDQHSTCCCTAMLLYCYAAILLYCYTAILPCCYTAILLYCYTATAWDMQNGRWLFNTNTGSQSTTYFKTNELPLFSLTPTPTPLFPTCKRPFNDHWWLANFVRDFTRCYFPPATNIAAPNGK